VTLLALALACAGAKDGADSAEPRVPGMLVPLDDARAIFTGDPSSAAGSAVALGGGHVVVGAPFVGRVCAWNSAPEGAQTLATADACYIGEGAQDFAGQSLDAGGDLDGDGAPDLVVGALANEAAGDKAGRAYVVRGPLLPTDTGARSLAEADAVLTGEAAGDYAGVLVRFAGDLDGDGRTELLVGAVANARGGTGAGAVYLYRGMPASGSLAGADLAIVGAGPTPGAPPPPHGAPGQGDGVGAVADGAGDVNGDGFGDLVLGANGSDLGGTDSGATGVFLGPLGAGERAFADADRLWIGSGGTEYFGDQVAGVGDLDADGYDDVVSVSQGDAPGTVVVLPGAAGAGQAPRRSDDAPVRFVGEAPYDQAGASATGAGDTDGDGWPDLLVGAYGNDRGTLDGGAAYLLRGPFSPGTHALADAAVRWVGLAEGDNLGKAVAGGHDVDGDGRDDVLLGALYDDTGGPFAGRAWLFTEIPTDR
jgi:hypothetical protein